MCGTDIPDTRWVQCGSDVGGTCWAEVGDAREAECGTDRGEGHEQEDGGKEGDRSRRRLEELRVTCPTALNAVLYWLRVSLGTVRDWPRVCGPTARAALR